MFFEMIRRRRDRWLAESDCPARPCIGAMVEAAKAGAKLSIVPSLKTIESFDPRFKMRRNFMEQVFKARQRNFPNLPAFKYLYLEEDRDGQWRCTFIDAINAFFKE